MENQDIQLLVLQLLKIISGSKQLVSKFPSSMLKEIKNVFWRLKETFAFVVLTIFLVCVDYSIAKFIDVFRRHGNYGVTFPGSSQGFTLDSLVKSKEIDLETHELDIQAFDLRTDPCLPRPIYTHT